ncbi:MAG TPA: MFS transporter, partial [Polyangiaceae bacterium LLY-WYZ-15_(1-7)]|nr:MFS transporter [Polyangiaceae bacterium LLY-WYZ-15_(1-7)]
PPVATGAPSRIWTGPFLLAWAASFVSTLAIHSYVHLPGLLEEWGASEALIGAAISTTSLTALLARPLVGRFMDERGRRGVALVGGVVHVAACALYPTIGGVGVWLFVVRGVHGLATAMLFSVFFTMAADLVPEARRTEGMALFGVSGMLPISLGPLLGDVVLRHADFQALFLILLALAGVGFLASLSLPETRPKVQARPPGGMKKALLQPSLRPLWFVGVVFAVALTAYFVFLKTFVKAAGIGEISSFFTPYAVTAVLLRVFLGWVPDRIGVKRALFPALGLLGLGLVGLAFATEAWHVALIGVVCGMGHGYVFPILSSLIVTRAPAEDRGAAVTLFTALFDVGILLGGPLLGGVADWMGHRAMFVVAAALTALGLAVFARWDR